METHEKEVYFHLYCKSCKHCKVKNVEEPCNECLEHPINIDTHRPVNWEAK